MVSFMVKLPKSRKAAVKGVFFRPLSILELDFDYRQKAALQRIRDVRFAYAYQSLPYDPTSRPWRCSWPNSCAAR